jgi:nucleoside-diphosphate-sugar epimerase
MRRVVYTTTAGVRDPSVPGHFKHLEKGTHRYAYFEGKHANEVIVQKAAEEKGWAWTIFKPAYFLSNFLNPMAKFMYPLLAEHRIVTVTPANWKNYFVDPEDIGRLCAVSLLGPRWGGLQLPDLSSQKIDLVSQVGRLEDATCAMEKALAKQGISVKIEVEHITPEEAEKRGIDSVKTQYEQFLVENPAALDLEWVRNLGFELGTMNAFFEREVERLKEVLAL